MADLTDGLVGLALSTLSIVVFGEIVPQAACSRHGLYIGANTVWIVKLFIILMYPVAWPISVILDKVLGRDIGQAGPGARGSGLGLCLGFFRRVKTRQTSWGLKKDCNVVGTWAWTAACLAFAARGVEATARHLAPRRSLIYRRRRRRRRRHRTRLLVWSPGK